LKDKAAMHWKLILQLSMFGLAMGLATVFVIPSNVEPAFWLVIFVVCAYIIARQCPGKPFVHGLLLGLANSIWITAAHAFLFNQYLATHAREAEMMKSMPLPDSPRLTMVLTGPVIGVVSGIVIGLFAMVASKLVKPRTTK
jgi:hypothetical protein